MYNLKKEEKKLADSGNIDSKYNLGYMYSEGKEVEKSTEKSIFWYQEAAKKGHHASQVILGKF